MNELKLTPIDQIEDMADGVPVLAVEGTVKLALDVTTGTSKQGHPWSKQFFVLTNGTAEIACTMWDATGSEMTKDENVHIENTQNKKGVWAGMVKGSYQKNGERKHTLEIRANQVKIKSLDAQGRSDEIRDMGARESVDDWQEAPATAPESSVRAPNGDAGVMETRKHIMQSANLYVLCVKAVNSYVALHLPESSHTPEQFKDITTTLFIEASHKRTNDGVNWWSYVDRMPTTPIKENK